MRILFNFYKNAGVLAALLCYLFFNPGEGKAQSVTVLTTPTGNTIKIIYSEGAVCGNQPQAKLMPVPAFDWPTLGTLKSEMVNNIGNIPKSDYFKINKQALGNPTLRIEATNPVQNAFIGNTNISSSFGSLNTPSPMWPNGAFNNPQMNNPQGFGSNIQNEFGFGRFWNITLFSTNPNEPTNKYFLIADGVAWLLLKVSMQQVNNNNSESVFVLLPFAVLGTIEAEVPVLGTTVQPQIPYLVLHAPPGDGSSSGFDSTKTTCREFVNTYAEDGSNSANLDVKLGIAGSLGFIATVDFEFSVTFSAGVSAGDLAVTTKSNQTCVTASESFSTNALPGLNGGGDVFIGYGTDLNYGIFTRIAIDPNTCEARLDTGLIYQPTGIPRRFTWTETQIQADILAQKAIADNPANSVRARNEAQNQADVWEKILALNNVNKNNPNNELIESLSFSAGANSSQESSITVVETNALEVEHYTEFNTGISSVVEIGGSGVSGGYEYRGSYRYGKTQNQSQETSKVVSYTLADDDTDGAGDLFNLKVVRDPMFGTPIFRLESSSRTSCPYQGGYQRDQPRVKHLGTANDHITITGAPLGLDSSAIFQIQVCNNNPNEEREYLLGLSDNSNPGGARVFASGFELNVPRSYDIAANGCETITIEVKRLSTNSTLSYPDLELVLYPECEPGISSSIFASVFFGNATGVNDLADNSLLMVSPNPTSGWLQISLPAGNTLEAVRVMDLSGKTVQNIELGTAASNTEIDLSSLPKGIYTLQARAEGQVFVKKVVVE